MLRNERCEIQKTEKEKEAEVLVPADFEAQVECSEWFVNHTFKKKKKKHALLPEAEVAFRLAVCLSVRPSREGPAHIAVSHRQSSSTYRNSCL